MFEVLTTRATGTFAVVKPAAQIVPLKDGSGFVFSVQVGEVTDTHTDAMNAAKALRSPAARTKRIATVKAARKYLTLKIWVRGETLAQVTARAAQLASGAEIRIDLPVRDEMRTMPDGTARTFPTVNVNIGEAPF